MPKDRLKKLKYSDYRTGDLFLYTGDDTLYVLDDDCYSLSPLNIEDWECDCLFLGCVSKRDVIYLGNVK